MVGAEPHGSLGFAVAAGDGERDGGVGKDVTYSSGADPVSAGGLGESDQHPLILSHNYGAGGAKGQGLAAAHRPRGLLSSSSDAWPAAGKVQAARSPAHPSPWCPRRSGTRGWASPQTSMATSPRKPPTRRRMVSDRLSMWRLRSSLRSGPCSVRPHCDHNRSARSGSGGITPGQRGAPEGIRTPNLLIRSQMLYPLSYGRVFGCADAGTGRAEAPGFEPGMGLKPQTALAVRRHRPD